MGQFVCWPLHGICVRVRQFCSWRKHTALFLLKSALKVSMIHLEKAIHPLYVAVVQFDLYCFPYELVHVPSKICLSNLNFAALPWETIYARIF
jgi:hypothetical protein